MEKISVIVELAGDNYSAYSNELLGCVSTGDTFDELKANMWEDGDSIPKEFQGEYGLEFHCDAKNHSSPT